LQLRAAPPMNDGTSLASRSPDAGDEDAGDGSAELPTIVGKNLRRLRTRRGHSLERLAKLSGVSRAMLGQIETGKSTPTISLLWKVATALDVPFANLLAAQTARGTVVLKRDDAKVCCHQQMIRLT
jgi:DNA-binding XRE family transcriptional regulator